GLYVGLARTGFAAGSLTDFDVVVADDLAPARDLGMHECAGRLRRTLVFRESFEAFGVPFPEQIGIGDRLLQCLVERRDHRLRSAGGCEQPLPETDFELRA